VLNKAVGIAGESARTVVSTAINLYYQTLMDVSLSKVPVAVEADVEWMYIFDNACVDTNGASLFLGYSPYSLRRMEDDGDLVKPNGDKIEIFRDRRDRRWYTPENLWDIAHVLYRRGRVKPETMVAMLNRIQEQFVVKDSRSRLKGMRGYE
jgi:hypothetical protein